MNRVQASRDVHGINGSTSGCFRIRYAIIANGFHFSINYKTLSCPHNSVAFHQIDRNAFSKVCIVHKSSHVDSWLCYLQVGLLVLLVASSAVMKFLAGWMGFDCYSGVQNKA